MSSDLLITLLFIAGGFIVLFFFLNSKFSSKDKNSEQETLIAWLKQMQSSVEMTNKTLNDAMRSSSSETAKILQENARQLNERLDRAAVVIQTVGKEVGQMSEIGRSMKDLQAFLKSPKLRGNIGEEVLKDLIAQMFPKNSFHLQYQFRSGERVDAAITTDAGILPIDSKFPMENYERMMQAGSKTPEYTVAQKEFIRDVKKHIDVIARKYILPEEGTMDFALMYVPSESVYYEIVCINDLVSYARKHRVYFVSPTTLYAHLQTILLSFEGKKIESQAREVFRLLRSLQIDYEKTNETMGVLGRHLGNAQSQFASLQSNFLLFGNKLRNAEHLEGEAEKKELPN